MRKNKWIAFAVFIFCLMTCRSFSQTLVVSQEIQEYDQWCWAADTKCVLGYFGFSFSQCTIAEYNRSVATWHDFGSTNCCTDATQGCNYWNYNWGTMGSMQDILVHFGGIQNSGVTTPLTTTDIQSNITKGYPFIMRWAWNSGGGHFLVGHGISGNNINYMNPWFGEGLHIADYNWLVNDGTHTWTSTNVISKLTTAIKPVEKTTAPGIIFPNPSNGKFSLLLAPSLLSGQTEIKIINALGEIVYSESFTDLNGNKLKNIDLSNSANGVYFVRVQSNDNCTIHKVIINR